MKKRSIILGAISLCVLIASIVTASIADFSLTKTWQGIVFVILFFIPLWILFWKLSTDLKKKNRVICYAIRFFEIVWVFIVLVSSILVITGKVN